MLDPGDVSHLLRIHMPRLGRTTTYAIQIDR